MKTGKTKVINEAIRRLEELVERFGLNPNVVNYFKEGKVYYSYLTGAVLGSVDTVTYDPRYSQAIIDFEAKYDGFIVFHAIEHQETLSLLYVSNNKKDWPAEVLTGNYIAAYTINFNTNIAEFGDIYIEGYMNSGALVRVEPQSECIASSPQIQVKPTKKHLVDFISHHCLFDGISIPKAELNRVPKDELMKLVNSDESLKGYFDEYLIQVSNNVKKTIVTDKSTDSVAAAAEFRCAVNLLLGEPLKLLSSLRFEQALSNLPFNSISSDELLTMVEKLAPVDSAHSKMLLKYATEQLLKGKKKA